MIFDPPKMEDQKDNREESSTTENSSSESENDPEITANKAYSLYEHGNLQYVLVDEEVTILVLKQTYKLIIEESELYDLKKFNSEKLAALNLKLEYTYIHSIYGK